MAVVAPVTGASLLLSAYPLGRLSDRVGRKGILVGATLVAAGGAVSLLLVTTLFQVLVVSILLGAGVGAYFSTSWAMATDLVSAGRTGQQMGVASAAAAAGASLAKLAGPGIDVLNRLEGALGYSVLLVACAVLFVLGAALLKPVPTNVARPP